MKVLLTVHLIAAIFLVGPAVAGAMSAPAAIRSGKVAAVALITRLVTVYSIGSIIVAVLGLAMVRGKDSGGGFAFSDTWIIASIVLYVIALVVTLAVLIPALRAAGTALGAAATDAAGTDARGAVAKPLIGRVAGSGGIIALLYLAIVVLMVYRP